VIFASLCVVNFELIPPSSVGEVAKRCLPGDLCLSHGRVALFLAALIVTVGALLARGVDGRLEAVSLWGWPILGGREGARVIQFLKSFSCKGSVFCPVGQCDENGGLPSVEGRRLLFSVSIVRLLSELTLGCADWTGPY